MLKSIISAVFLGAAAVATAQTPASLEFKTSVEGISEYRVKSNGLRVLLFPDLSKQTITVNITYLVGSASEGYGETGMAHLLEHLVFKGTPNHPNPSKELKDHGCDFNGTTWYDRTNYYETFSATDENLEWALSLESDRMVNSNIAKKDLETEFSVVRNEFESGENDPAGVLMERVVSTAFLWHNYGKSTIGNRSDIENVPIENLQAFYRRYYQPDNAVLLIGGKFDTQKVLALVDKYFAKIPKPTRQLPKNWTVEPTQDGERNVVLKRVGEVQVVSCGYHMPAGSHPDFAATLILQQLLTDAPSGRLHKALIATDKATGLWGYEFLTKEPSFVYFNVDVRKEQNLEEAKSILLKTLDDLAKNPPTEEEVNRAKANILKQFETVYRNTERAGTFLSEFMGMGDWRMFFLLRDNLEKATVAEVARAAKLYYKPSNRTIGLFLPEAAPDRSEIPATPDVALLVEGYKGKKAMAEGEVFDPSTTNIEKRTTRGKLGTIDFAFLPKTTRGNTVSATLNLRFGDLSSLQNKRLVAYLTARMINKGTQKMTEQQIKEKFDNLKANVTIGGSEGRVSVGIETTKENLPEVVKIVQEMLLQPAFPEDKFEEIRREELAGSEQQLTDPQALAQNAWIRHLNPYDKKDVRYTPTIQEEIEELKAIKLADIKQFYKDFYGASNASMAVVGDFNADEIKKIVNDGLAKWKSPKAYKRISKAYVDVPAKNEAIKTPDKANAMFFAGVNLPLSESDPDYAALVIGDYIVGGGGLSSRLADRIRQKEGISYGVGSFLNADPIEKSGMFGAYAIYAPENVTKLEAAFKEEIQRVLTDGVSEEELNAAKKAYIQSLTVGRTNDRQVAGKLNSYLALNRTMDWDAKFEAAIQKLTVADVNAALKKRIDLSKISIIKAGDFDKAKKP